MEDWKVLASNQLKLAEKEIRSSQVPVEPEFLVNLVSGFVMVGEKNRAANCIELLVAQAESTKQELELLTALKERFAQHDSLNFDTCIAVLEMSNVHGSRHLIDEMKASMVSKAGRERRFKMAERLLSSMIDHPNDVIYNGTSNSNHNVVMAGKFLVAEYVRSEQPDSAIRVAEMFRDDFARGLLAFKIYRMSGSPAELEESIERLLIDSGRSTLTNWCKELFNAAMKKKDYAKAQVVLSRLERLEFDQLTYFRSRLNTATQKAQVENKEHVPSTQRLLDKKPREKKDIEKLVNEYGSLSRQDCTPQSRLSVSDVQPLHNVAVELAKSGQIEYASALAGEIKDEYWRAATLESIGHALFSSERKLGKSFREASISTGKSVTPIEDRDQLFASIATRRIRNPLIDFSEVQSVVEQIGDARERALAIADQMEFRIRSRNVTKSQTDWAINVIVSGDTDSLASVVDGLLEVGDVERATEAVLKIRPELEYEIYPHIAFTEAAKSWNIGRQLTYISQVFEKERPIFFTVALNSANTEDIRLILAAMVKHLEQHGCHGGVYKQVLKHSLELKQIDILEQLLEVDISQHSYLKKHVQRHVEEFAVSNPESFSEIEPLFDSGWTEEVLIQARIFVVEEDSAWNSVIEEIERQPDLIARAKLRYEAAIGLIRKRVLTNNK